MKTWSILLVDEDQDDVDFFAEALARRCVDCTLHVCSDGSEAVKHLASLDILPDLIVTDFAFPKDNALVLLYTLKNHARFVKIPVIVFTTSSYEITIRNSEGHGASLILAKPTDLQMMDGLVDQMLALLYHA